MVGSFHRKRRRYSLSDKSLVKHNTSDDSSLNFSGVNPFDSQESISQVSLEGMFGTSYIDSNDIGRGSMLENSLGKISEGMVVDEPSKDAPDTNDIVSVKEDMSELAASAACF